MDHDQKTNAQLVAELQAAQARIADLESRLSQVCNPDVQQATDALKATEENYRSLVENSENAVAVLDRTGHIVYANAYTVKIWDDPQVIGKNISDIYPTEYADRYFRSIQQVIDTQTSIVHEMESLINGRTMWFRLSISPLKNADGSVSTVLLNAWDLTESKLAEDALRISEERHRQFILQSFEGILRTEFDQPVDISLPMEAQIDLIYENAYMAECNQAMAEMYHLSSPDDLIGKHMIDMHVMKDDPVNRASFREFILNGYRSMNAETVEYDRNGDRVWFLNNTVGTIENGKLVRMWGTAIDITTHKKMEVEKQALIESLNERATDLTLLLNAGRELSETLDLQQIYDISYRYISAAVPCTNLIISSFDPQMELLTCEYLHTEEGPQDVSGFPPIPLEPPGQGTQSRVIRSGESLLLPDYVAALRTARTSYHFDEIGQIIDEEPDEGDLARSAIIVPLKVNGNTAGALQILSHSLNAHTEDHLRFVEAFAFRVSAALSNARLFAELEKRVQERTAEIENTRQRLELATRAAGLGIWDWNIKTRQIIWDRQMEVIYGEEITRSENKLEGLLSTVHSEDRMNLSQFMKNKLENQANNGSIQYRIIQRNGTTKHVETHAIVVRDTAENPIHLIGVSRDITQEKLAEDALRQREETYRALFNNSNDGIFLISPQGEHQMANPRALEMLEYTVEEYVQLSNDQMVDPSERGDAGERFQAMLRGETVPLYERTLISKSGKRIDVEINLSAIRDANGHVLMVQSVIRDITQRKLAERAIRESEERYRKAISAANAVPYNLDYATNSYTFIGEGIEHITGYTREEMKNDLSSPFFLDSRLRGDLAGLSVNEASKRMRTGQLPGNVVWNSDLLICNKSGESRWLSDTAVQILNEQGQPTGAIGILQDITERKITEEYLRQANRELERALRVKDEFLASMSHELRTPLTGILGLSEALQYNTYGEINVKQRRILGNIENSGRHLLDLINDILDISKMEAGKLELDIEPCPLAEVCQSSIQLTKGMMQKNEQNIVFSMKPDNITVLGDPRRLKQIMVNLLSNAIKYSPSRTRIDLDVVADTQSQTVKISVADQGIGITKDDLGKLFQPFMQVDSSLSRQQSGTGLGLALVKRLVELHGGTVEVESTHGVGSRFTVTLVTPSLEAIRKNTRLTQPLQVQTALVIEDSPVDSDRLIRYLKILGIQPTVLAHGDDALAKVCEIQPGVILLDIYLPETSGWDVLSQLKNNDNTRHIPVVITSVEEDRGRASQLGASGYLVKPFSLPDLNTVLARAQSAVNPVVYNTPEERSQTATTTIMLVDDNEVNTFMIEDFLVSRNFKVVTATSGLAFLSQADTVKPDIVLMDVQMPEIDGLETIRRLRLHPNPQLAAVPVIAITALAMPGDRERCLEAGANEYVSKPIRLVELNTLIENMLK